MVVGAALAAGGLTDLALPATGHETASVHAGRHPAVSAAAIGVAASALGFHFRIHRWRP